MLFRQQQEKHRECINLIKTYNWTPFLLTAFATPPPLVAGIILDNLFHLKVHSIYVELSLH